MPDCAAIVRRARAVFLQIIKVAAFSVVTAAAAAAQPANGVPQCRPVGGTVMTNLIDQTTTLGTATGDLRGAVSADLLGPPAPGPNGTTVFSVQHHWVTDTGETIYLDVAQATTSESLQACSRS